MLTKIGAEMLEKAAAAKWKQMLPALTDEGKAYLKAFFPQHNARRLGALDDAISRRHEAHETVAGIKNPRERIRINEGQSALENGIEEIGKHNSTSVLTSETRLLNQTLHSDELVGFGGEHITPNFRYMHGENKLISDAAGVDDIYKAPLKNFQYGRVKKNMDKMNSGAHCIYNPGEPGHGIVQKTYDTGNVVDNMYRAMKSGVPIEFYFN